MKGFLTVAVAGHKRPTTIRSARVPAYLLLGVAGIVLEMFNQKAHYIGFPVSPDRVCIALAVVLLVLDPEASRAVRLRVRPVHVLLVAMIGLATYSAATYGTLTTSTGFYALLDRLGVLPFAFFALAPVLFRTESDRQFLVRALILVALYLGLVALFEQVGLTELIWPRYINNPNIGLHYGRARGPFVEAVANGIVMVQTGLVSAWFASRQRGAWRLAAVVAAFLCALGVLFTLTRAVWLAGPAGVLVAMLLTSRVRRFVPVAVAAGVLAVVGILAASPSLSNAVHHRSDAKRTVWDRYNTDEAALRIVDQRPLTGVGWVRFIDVEKDYIRQAATYPLTADGIEVHNVLLSRAAELGVPGAALWLVCVVAGPGFAATRRSRPEDASDVRLWRAVAAGGATTWFLAAMFGPMPYPMVNLLVWLYAGLALSPYLARIRAGSPNESLIHTNLIGTDERVVGQSTR